MTRFVVVVIVNIPDYAYHNAPYPYRCLRLMAFIYTQIHIVCKDIVTGLGTSTKFFLQSVSSSTFLVFTDPFRSICIYFIT